MKLDGGHANGLADEVERIRSILESIVAAAKSGKPAEQVIRFSAMKPIQIAEQKTATKLQDPLLDQLTPGTWIEIHPAQPEESLRCRLVVFVEETQTYVFSNDLGLKAYEASATEMLHKLKAREIEILTDEPIVERALADLVTDLEHIHKQHSKNTKG